MHHLANRDAPSLASLPGPVRAPLRSQSSIQNHGDDSTGNTTTWPGGLNYSNFSDAPVRQLPKQTHQQAGEAVKQYQQAGESVQGQHCGNKQQQQQQLGQQQQHQHLTQQLQPPAQQHQQHQTHGQQARENTRKQQPGQASRHKGLKSRTASSQDAGELGLSPPSAMLPADWRTWPHLDVVLVPLPADVSIEHIMDAFSKLGTVDAIRFGQGPNGEKNGSAAVCFSPPPDLDFAHLGDNPFVLQAGVRSHFIMVKPMPCCTRFVATMPSSVRSGVVYPERLHFNPSSLQFGVMSGEKSFMVMKALQRPQSHDVGHEWNLSADFKRKMLTVHFGIPISTNLDPTAARPSRTIKCDIHFLRLRKLYRELLPDGQVALVIPMTCPPSYFEPTNHVASAMQPHHRVWYRSRNWRRITHLVEDEATLEAAPITLTVTDAKVGVIIDIGRWTVLRVVLDNRAELDVMLDALHDFNVVSLSDPSVIAVERKEGPRWELLDAHERAIANNQSALALLAEPFVRPMDYAVRYQLECLLSRNLLVEQHINQAFLEKLSEPEPLRARYMLEYFSDRDKRVWEPMEVFGNQEAAAFYPIGPELRYRTWVRKVIVTPTTMRFGPPTVDAGNRVLRKFRHVQDRFLRVQFLGEALEGPVFGGPDSANNAAFDRFSRALLKGLWIGGRHFQFLAFGNSQIRESSAYFFASTPFLTRGDILEWMGNFSHIKVVAKYASRLGQCFSTTHNMLGVQVPEIVRIPDMEKEVIRMPDMQKERYCFTDGVGKISALLASMITRDTPPRKDMAVPSVYQYRLGGCKGILAVWPEAKGTQVHIRPSQEKFQSEAQALEIIKCSEYSVATLNRQIITVLSCRGVPADSFMKLLNSQLGNYNKAMIDQSAAIDLLTKYVDENQVTLSIADMVRSGFADAAVEEPFVATLLHLWKVWSLKLLKEKARIVVEKSAFVFGCVDETGVLRGHSVATEMKTDNRREDLPQIFLQIPNPDDCTKTVAVTGLCIVGRNPSLHPGDIRVVEAVDVPELRHLRNVVVFPSTGDRDVPSMLSGGDLDGDEFFVMWEPGLIPPRWNHPPLNFKHPPPRELGRPIEIDDIASFFVTYMRNNNLGRIAVAHLGSADYYRELGGAKHIHCLTLARLHSMAVDYAKTGVESALPPHLEPPRWPHFMEKRFPSYRSTSVLGRIYDRVQSMRFDPLYSKGFDERVLDAFEPTAQTMKTARQIKSEYDKSLRRIMQQRGVVTEFEVWTGFALSKPVAGSDYKQSEELGSECRLLRQSFQAECHRATVGKRFADVAPLLVAMYRVTEQELVAAWKDKRDDQQELAVEVNSFDVFTRKTKSMPFISFPWIFPEFLGRIALGEPVKHNKNLDTPLTEPVAPKAKKSVDTGLHGLREKAREYAAPLADGTDVGAVGEKQQHPPQSPSDVTKDDSGSRARPEEMGVEALNMLEGFQVKTGLSKGLGTADGNPGKSAQNAPDAKNRQRPGLDTNADNATGALPVVETPDIIEELGLAAAAKYDDSDDENALDLLIKLTKDI